MNKFAPLILAVLIALAGAQIWSSRGGESIRAENGTVADADLRQETTTTLSQRTFVTLAPLPETTAVAAPRRVVTTAVPTTLAADETGSDGETTEAPSEPDPTTGPPDPDGPDTTENPDGPDPTEPPPDPEPTDPPEPTVPVTEPDPTVDPGPEPEPEPGNGNGNGGGNRTTVTVEQQDNQQRP